ncbi:MAG: hypothetical protein NTY38_15900, partial [Acidobacteria bacterium]|nr:hypothetical protein [Acidobacteriota bacterium]
QIFDPDPALGRTLLSEYQAGLAAVGQAIRGELTGAVRLVPGAASAATFLVTASAEVEVSSVSGVCGRSLELFDLTAPLAPGTELRPPTRLRLRPCAASDALYQLDVAATGDFDAAFTDLASPGLALDLSGSGPAAYRIGQEGGNWSVSPLRTEIAAGSLVNAASLTPEIARGGLISLFGSGLAGAGAATTVEIGGAPAVVTLASPFRLNVRVPQELAAGAYTVHIESLFGTAEHAIEIAEFAPAIVVTAGRQGVVTGVNGALISTSNPAPRGRAVTIYSTGLGRAAISASGVTLEQPVRAVFRDQEVEAGFTGFAPGLIGIYAVQATIPSGLAPASAVSLQLRQAGKASNAAEIAIQ